MTRETKVGLLVGMGVILLIGIIVSDHLAVMQQERREVSDFADQAQRSIEDPADHAAGEANGQRSSPAPGRQAPAAGSGERERWTPDLDLDPGPDLQPASPSDRIAGQRGMPPATALENTRRPRQHESPPPPEQLTRRGMSGQGTGDPRTLQIGSPSQVSAGEPASETQARREAPQAEAAASEEAGPDAIVHRVQRRETLYDIARDYYGNGDYWRSIAEQNPDVVDDNGHVRHGVELAIPNRAGMVRSNGSQIQAVAEQANRAMRGRDTRGQTIQVERGDTLSGLAARHLGSSGQWRRLLEANRDKLESAADLRAGMTLQLPGDARSGGNGATARARTYTIRQGDTLTRIAEQELGDGDRWRELYEANQGKLDSPDSLPVGEEILIPS